MKTGFLMRPQRLLVHIRSAIKFLCEREFRRNVLRDKLENLRDLYQQRQPMPGEGQAIKDLEAKLCEDPVRDLLNTFSVFL